MIAEPDQYLRNETTNHPDFRVSFVPPIIPSGLSDRRIPLPPAFSLARKPAVVTDRAISPETLALLNETAPLLGFSRKDVGSKPDEAYPRLPVIGRRGLGAISLGLGLAAVGCSEQPQKQELRRAEGVWSKEEVVKFAEAMMTETDFGNIYAGGEILLGNQQGKPTFSQENSFFVDDQLPFITVHKIASPYKNAQAVAGVHVERIGPLFSATLKSRVKGPDYVLNTLTRARAIRLDIDHGIIRDASDFFLKFVIAQQMYNFKSFDLATTIVASDFFLDYVVPEDPQLRNAAKVFTFGITTDKTPTGFIAEMFSHFIMVPEYNKAKDRKRFTNADIRKIGNLYNTATRIFQQEKILEKTGEGDYVWSPDVSPDRFYQVWTDLAITAYKAGI